jgi:hypothetical protein
VFVFCFLACLWFSEAEFTSRWKIEDDGDSSVRKSLAGGPHVRLHVITRCLSRLSEQRTLNTGDRNNTRATA